MATRTVKARVELDGEKQYKQALSELNQGNKVLASEMRKLQAEYKGNAESTEFLTKKGDLLQRQLQQQQDKVNKLKEALQASAEKYGEADKRTQDWVIKLNNAEAAQYDLEHAIEENNDALTGQNDKMIGIGDTVEIVASKLGIKIPDGAKKALNGINGLSAGTVAKMAAAAGAIAAVVKALSELHKMTLEAAAEVDSLLTDSITTGLSTQTLQELKYAENLIDVSVNTITGSLTKLTRNMVSANEGNAAMAESFANLGVSITNEIDGSLRPAEDVFYEIVDALGRISNETERDAISMEIFGKSAQELNPLIEQGSNTLREYAKEAQNVGYILSNEELNALGAVDDAFQRMNLTIDAVKKQISADFAPASEAAMNLFSDVVKKAGEILKRAGIIENLASIISSLTDILHTAGELLTGIPGFTQKLNMVKAVLGGIAQLCALIADTADVIAGIFTLDFNRIGNAMGFGKSSGTLSHWQTVYMSQEGTLGQYQEYYANKNGGSTHDGYGFDTATGQYYDIKTGNYVYNTGWNASGNENWRGGLTWLGENGPELVRLPQGSNIYNNQESRHIDGNTVINITVNGIKEMDEVIGWYKTRQLKERMA